MCQGQEERAHKRAKICPIVGPGSLSKSARKRRAREIIAESGADTVEHFTGSSNETQRSYSGSSRGLAGTNEDP